MSYTSWNLGLGDLNITYFYNIRGGVEGSISNVTNSFVNFAVTEPLNLLYEFSSVVPGSNYPIQLFRAFDEDGFEVTFSYSFPGGEHYDLYITESTQYISVMYRSNSFINNITLKLTPKNSRRAPVNIKIKVSPKNYISSTLVP